MKVLHVLQSDTFSGAENVVCQIIDLFQGEIEMAYASKEGPIKNALKERGVKFFSMSKLCKSELSRVISEYKPNLIHAHDVSASITSILVSKKIPVISHIHVNNANMSKINLKTILYLVSTIKYKHIFWVSNSCYDNYIFKSLIKKKSSILCNVMDINMIIKRLEKDKKSYLYDVVYVGRITYQKNPEFLIEILKTIIDKNSLLRIAIVGSGDLLDLIKDEAKNYPQISFLGYIDNPLKIIHDAKTLIMTSRYEGTPMTALEAMAVGVPIVTTPTDGMLDLIENGKNGFFCNTVEEFIFAIENIVSNNELRKQMSVYTKNKFINMMDIEQYYLEIKDIYFNTLSE